MLKRLLTSVFGKFESREEVKKYALLGITFGILLAAYWGLRPIKDGIFQGIVGVDYQPYAKWLSLVVVLFIIAIYGKLVDLLPRHKVFYLLTGIWAIGLLIFYIVLANPTYGIPNTVESPTRIVGWLWYIFVESIGTLFVPLFWAFSADVSTADSAKRGFPLIMLCAQFGNMCGPWFLRARRLGFVNSAPIVAIAGVMLLIVGALIWLFMRVIPKSEFHAPKEEKKKEAKPGFLEGLKLLLTHGYLLGIFVFLLAFEAVATIVDFSFKLQVRRAFPDELMRSDYFATFAVITGILSFLSLLFGISNIQRKLGMRASLVTLPLLMIIGVIIWCLYPSMLVAGCVVVAFKGLNYALNQPSIKQLYIPTTEDTRYKAQAWIEVFGSRGSKAIGSGINALKLPLTGYFGPATGLSLFMTLASTASISLLVFWIIVAFYVAQKYNKAIKEDTVVC
jgi:AAA family ATP:ADP antiporter